MKPTYQIRVWQEDDWWLARVVAASEDADTTPLNALTQARSLARIESMGRDLIAAILDAEEDTFDIDVEYVLAGEVSDLVCQAKGARAWMEAAQDLWQERSKMAARALADEGHSLRETATLLGLSHQRVDQLLASRIDHEQSRFVVICEGESDAATLRQTISSSLRRYLGVAIIATQGSFGMHSCGIHMYMQGSHGDQFKTLVEKIANQIPAGDYFA